MIEFFTKQILYMVLFIQCFSIQGMFTALRNRQLTTQSKRAGYNQVAQRRYQWQSMQPAQKEIQWKPNPLVLKTDYPNKAFLTKGEAIANSTYWLPNVLKYNIEQHKLDTSDSMAKFSTALFEISPNGQISLVHDKNKVSYMLTPEFFGVLRGAQEKGLLDDATVVKKIVALGQAEYTKMVGDNTTFPEAEIRDFIIAMNEAHKNDSNMAQSLEDAYLFLRINPSDDHDMIHYLLGFNRYAEILSEQRLKDFETILAQQNQVVHLSDLDYHHSDYEKFEDELLKISMPADRIRFAHKNFPRTMSVMIQDKRNKKLYSSRVEMDEISYKNQPAFSTCAESAFRDLFNNMFFDEELQIFNPLKFFPTLAIDSNVRAFYDIYKDENTINDKNVGKDFLELVSGVKGVTYVNKDTYEISSIANEQNLIALCNKFFSIQAKSLSDLGKMLSNERRTFTFERMNRDGNNTIAITIHDKQTDKTKYMYLNFAPGHTTLKVGKGNRDNTLLDPKILLAEYNDPQSRALLYVHPQPVIDQLFFRKIKNSGNAFDASVYYAFPAKNDGEKSQLIRAILLYSSDQKALDYAYFLFDSLSDKYKNSLKDVVPSGDIFKQKLKAYETLKE